MWYFRQSNNILVLCALLLSAGFLVQFKVLYNNHQKHLRIQEIRGRMTELSDSLNSVESVANTTSILISKLTSTLRSRKMKRARLKAPR